MTGVTTSEHYLGLSVFPTSPYYARVHVQRVLEGWRRDDLIETAQLVVSELVSNAIKAHASFFAATEATAHASPDHIWMDLYRADETVVLRVWDAGRTPPVLRNPDPDDEGGRGLYLVDLIAKEWGYYWPASAERSSGVPWRPRRPPGGNGMTAVAGAAPGRAGQCRAAEGGTFSGTDRSSPSSASTSALAAWRSRARRALRSSANRRAVGPTHTG